MIWGKKPSNVWRYWCNFQIFFMNKNYFSIEFYVFLNFDARGWVTCVLWREKIHQLARAFHFSSQFLVLAGGCRGVLPRLGFGCFAPFFFLYNILVLQNFFWEKRQRAECHKAVRQIIEHLNTPNWRHNASRWTEYFFFLVFLKDGVPWWYIHVYLFCLVCVNGVREEK